MRRETRENGGVAIRNGEQRHASRSPKLKFLLQKRIMRQALSSQVRPSAAPSCRLLDENVSYELMRTEYGPGEIKVSSEDIMCIGIELSMYFVRDECSL